MPRGKPRRAVLGTALGDGFPAFIRILQSETVPPPDDLFDFWEELCIGRLEYLALENFPHSGSSLSPKYSVWLVLSAVARIRAQKSVEGMRTAALSLDVAIRNILLGNKWLYVRDELRKFAALALTELERRAAVEAKLRGGIASVENRRQSGPRSKNAQLLDFETNERKKNANLTDKELLERFKAKCPNHPIFETEDPGGALRAARSRKKKKTDKT